METDRTRDSAATTEVAVAEEPAWHSEHKLLEEGAILRVTAVDHAGRGRQQPLVSLRLSEWELVSSRAYNSALLSQSPNCFVRSISNLWKSYMKDSTVCI